MATITQNDQALFEQRAVERDRYVVLLHMYTLREVAPSSPCSIDKLTRDLGFTCAHAQLVIGSLAEEGYLARQGPGECYQLAARGVEYVETGARRRRSVRFPR